jgi:hypothetical protein
MTDFEREIVRCLNHFFKARHIQGFAYRPGKQNFTCQYVGVLADSSSPAYNLSIECKSIVDRKLYFSQHFRTDKNRVHHVDAISDFLAGTGRIGLLAVEFRQGPGKASEAYLIPWENVVGHFRNTNGITIEDARSCISLAYSNNGYVLEDF